jgi:hypothetical protein
MLPNGTIGPLGEFAETRVRPAGSGRRQKGQRVVKLLDDDSVAMVLVDAIRSGDLRTLDGLLQAHPSLASARIGAAGLRTPLHVVTDWPGYFPNGRNRTAFGGSGSGVPTSGQSELESQQPRPHQALWSARDAARPRHSGTDSVQANKQHSAPRLPDAGVAHAVRLRAANSAHKLARGLHLRACREPLWHAGTQVP